MDFVGNVKNKYELAKAQFMARRSKMSSSYRGFIPIELVVVAIMALVIGGILLAEGANILASVQTTLTVNGTAYNTAGNALTSLANLGTQFATLGTIVGFGLILLVLFFVFRPFLSQGQGGKGR